MRPQWPTFERSHSFHMAKKRARIFSGRVQWLKVLNSYIIKYFISNQQWFFSINAQTHSEWMKEFQEKCKKHFYIMNKKIIIFVVVFSARSNRKRSRYDFVKYILDSTTAEHDFVPHIFLFLCHIFICCNRFIVSHTFLVHERNAKCLILRKIVQFRRSSLTIISVRARRSTWQDWKKPWSRVQLWKVISFFKYIRKNIFLISFKWKKEITKKLFRWDCAKRRKTTKKIHIERIKR